MNWEQINNDFAQRHSGTYCRVLIEGREPIMSYIEHVETSNRGAGAITLRTKDQGAMLLNYNSDHEISVEYPPLGFIQHGKDAVYLTRKYVRQFRKGFSSASVGCDIPYGNFPVGLRPPRLDIDLYASAWNNRIDYGAPMAVEEIRRTKARGVRLSNDFAISLAPINTDRYVLFFRLTPVGWVHPVSGEVDMVDKRFQQEWEDHSRG